jgi:hypothetical protein
MSRREDSVFGISRDPVPIEQRPRPRLAGLDRGQPLGRPEDRYPERGELVGKTDLKRIFRTDDDQLGLELPCRLSGRSGIAQRAVLDRTALLEQARDRKVA